MEESEFLIFIGFILIVTVLIIISNYFSAKNKILRKLEKFTRRRISQIKSNELAKITGKVMPVAKPFIAPYSKRACVAYIFEVSQRVKQGKTSHWRTLVKKEDIQDFFLEQHGEMLMVKPSMHNYVLFMVEDKQVNSGTFNSPTPEFRAVLDAYGVETETWLGFNKTIRYTERIIEVGETITVGGIAKWKSLTEPIEGYSYSKIAALESAKEQWLVITDHPKAAISNKRKM